jgi:hypothetical protein
MRWMRRPWASDGLEHGSSSKGTSNPSAKAFAIPGGPWRCGFPRRLYLGPLGFDWFALVMVMTIVLAIGWMRTYWDASPKKQER